jgi:ribosomal protein L11 methyltransferase
VEGSPRSWPALDVLPPALPPSGHEALEEQLLLLLDDLGPVALESSVDGIGWRIFFDDGPARDRAVHALRERLRPPCTVVSVEVEDEGWAHKVQQELRAVRVGRFVVAPPWDVPLCTTMPPPPDEPGGDIVIVIEPSTGFGTGHHQSTRLCLAALAALPVAGRRVMDAGTGSGVLALAAARLGAREVVALDHDPDAVAAAHENAERNDLGTTVSVRTADLGAIALAPFDLVLANLTAWALHAYRTGLAGLVSPGGWLVASGFTHDQVPLVKDSFTQLAVEDERSEDDWVAITFRKAGVGSPSPHESKFRSHS